MSSQVSSSVVVPDTSVKERLIVFSDHLKVFNEVRNLFTFVTYSSDRKRG